MKIENSRSIQDLKNDFIKVFPFLKIEFFKKPHQKGDSSDENEMFDSNLKLETIRKVKTEDEIKLDENMNVGDFEKIMLEKFGLNVQVYRKERGKWLQTWVTDIWTLKDQNHRSKVLGDIDNSLA